MGYTFRFFASGGVDAVEGVFGQGRPGHTIFPYLLRKLLVTRPNHVSQL